MHYSQIKDLVISNETSILEEEHDLEKKCIIWDEDYFHEILDLEKQRTQRSGKSVLLMLLNINAICKTKASSHYLAANLTFLSNVTRETDIKGWYEHGCIVGVIFTEIEETDVKTATDIIAQKTREKLKQFEGIDNIDDSGISFKIYSTIAKDNTIQTQPINLKMLLPDPCSTSLPGTFSHFFCGLLRQRSLLLLGDVLLISLAQLLAIWVSYGFSPSLLQEYYIVYSLAFLLYPAALYIFDLYNVARKYQSRETFLRIAMVGILVGASSMTLFYTIPQLYVGRGLLALQMNFTLAFVTAWRLAYGVFFQTAKSKIGIFIVGAGKSGKAVYRLLNNYFSPYEVRGFIDDSLSGWVVVNETNPALQGIVRETPEVVGTSDDLMEVANRMGVRSAILAVGRNRTPRFTRAVLEARLGGMEIIELPTLYERFTGRVPVELIEDQWLLFSEGFHLLSREYVQRLKRLLDLIVSGVLLVLSFPLMLVTALAIYMDSPGTVLYQQDRVGQNSKVFKVFKFRSMRLNAEKGGAQWAQKHDARITRVGKWIRLLRIDELPQIWNVFLGEMSLVGPRPERPEFVQELEKMIPYYSTRHSVRPGITGWAQVNYPYGASVEDALRKLEFDVYYIKNMSMLLDIKILLKTVGVILLGMGAR